MTGCGITCGACPLAGLCGDPIPPARPLSADVARLAADVTALAEARWVDLVGEPLPEPKRELCGSCDAGLPMTCTCAAIDAYLDEALDPDAPPLDWAPLPGPAATSSAFFAEYTRPSSEAVARRAAEWGEAWAEVLALAESVGVLVDPDAPDVDPAEPKPEGAGCCGGACSR